MSDRVSIAECRIAKAPAVLKAFGLGSCLAVALYDPQLRTGGMGHLLLPNWSEQKAVGSPEKYVDEGIRRMHARLIEAGAQHANLVAKVAGGANMFEVEYQSLIEGVGARNARSARQVLAELGIPLVAEDVGGNRGRTVAFDLATGDLIIYCAHENKKTVL